MSTMAANVDSSLSGNPSDDIDKQKGPSIGSNAESPGGTLGVGGQSVQTGTGSSSHGVGESNGVSSTDVQSGSSRTNGGHA